MKMRAMVVLKKTSPEASRSRAHRSPYRCLTGSDPRPALVIKGHFRRIVQSSLWPPNFRQGAAGVTFQCNRDARSRRVDNRQGHALAVTPQQWSRTPRMRSA